jgi:N-acyl amino acid synthase of PEP-CTERM/exosortase system
MDAETIGPFRFIFVTSEADLEAVERMRYDVYCRELGGERAEDHPDGRERDSYDRASVHILVRSVADGEPVGSTRLVFPDPARAQPTPVFGALSAHDDQDAPLHPARLPIHSWVEASRLAVVPAYRRHSPLIAGSQSLQHSFLASAGLCLAVAALTAAFARPYCVTAHEPRTTRLLNGLGITQVQIGGPFEYHGTRVLSVWQLGHLAQTIEPGLADVYTQLSGWASRALAAPAVRLRLAPLAHLAFARPVVVL